MGFGVSAVHLMETNDLMKSELDAKVINTVMILSFRSDGSGQTVQTQIRLLL